MCVFSSFIYVYACACMCAVGRPAEEPLDINLIIIADMRIPAIYCRRTDGTHTAATGENTAELSRVRERVTPSLGGRRWRRPN